MSIESHFYYKKDRLNQLRGFCTTVMCECSQVQAAKRLNVEPATVNKQISSLERDLKLKLFSRNNPQKLTLTESGRKFYHEIIPIIQKIDSIFETFYDGLNEEKNRVIRIGAHHTIFYYLMPNYIKKFKKILPNTIFELKYAPLKECIDDLLSDKLDIVLYPLEEDIPECKKTLLYDLDPMILVNKNNPLVSIRDKQITYKDLYSQNLMMTDKDSILPYFQKICKEYKFKSYINFEEADWEMMKNFVKLDLGIHLYSDLYNLFPDLKDPEIVSKNVSHLFPKIKIYSIVKYGKEQIEIIKKFLEMTIMDF